MRNTFCILIKANSAADSGNMANAEEKTRTARNLTIVTVVLGVICIALVMVWYSTNA
jgi:hypothetical protein